MNEINQLKDLLKDFLSKEGYQLFKIDFNKSNKEGNLSVIVDKDTPISLDEIVCLSEKISAYLDEVDPIDIPYTLDVSSIGAEKPIDVTKLRSYIGSYVNLHLFTPFKGENILEGTIEKIENEEVNLAFFVKGKKTIATFPLKNVDKARLAIKF